MLSPVFLVCTRQARTSAVAASTVVTTTLPRWCRTLGLRRVPVTNEVEHLRASGDRAKHPLSGHSEGPAAVKSRPIKIGCFRCLLVRDGGAMPAAQADSLEPNGPHDPRDAVVIDPYPLVAEFGGDPGGAVGAVGVLVDRAYPLYKPVLDGLPGRPCGSGAAPVVRSSSGRGRGCRTAA